MKCLQGCDREFDHLGTCATVPDSAPRLETCGSFALTIIKKLTDAHLTPNEGRYLKALIDQRTRVRRG